MEESIFDNYDYEHFEYYDDHYHSCHYGHQNNNFYDYLIMLMVDLNDKRPPGEQKMQLHPSGFLRGRGPFLGSCINR